MNINHKNYSKINFLKSLLSIFVNYDILILVKQVRKTEIRKVSRDFLVGEKEDGTYFRSLSSCALWIR